ncbi:hypothetical protein PPL_12449 [Heterostelium album PN500]|uniref:FZ domain-containing protein n=1 Tax=Heterostelium pallidum (strain ATCC 26659 / Pp 5 / PN500) TaxID=670386 RepID=D3BMM6_HETP5|nr:hypothetical protein PPL_12449 [Heterostelium album PN500]EFA77238.1 hypothetical protein PPL_12449 [Heterostelium album PN500]|eukprot:XP_020429367.1 hypothetical protein PPL_12449 [Heterostelium album PN500]
MFINFPINFIPKCINASPENFNICQINDRNITFNISNMKETNLVFYVPESSILGYNEINTTDPTDPHNCSRPSSEFKFDATISRLYNVYFNKEEGPPKSCLIHIGEYLCSYYYSYNYPDPKKYCSDLCDIFYTGECAQYFDKFRYLNFNDSLHILPRTRDECYSKSAGLNNTDCRNIYLQDGIAPQMVYRIKYPGGVVRVAMTFQNNKLSINNNMYKLFSCIVFVTILVNCLGVSTAAPDYLCANVSVITNFKYCRNQNAAYNYIQLDLVKLQKIGPLSGAAVEAIKNAPFENNCYQVAGNVSFDDFVVEAIIALQYYPEEVPQKCPSVIGTYLCSSMFRYNYPNAQPFYNQSCSSLYAIDSKTQNYICPQNMTLTVSNTGGDDVVFQPFPFTLKECESSPEVASNGTLFAQGAITLPTDNGKEWKWVGPVITFDKYPGGVVKGSILGFGLLLAILLVIATLGFIMKQQQKK